MLREIVLSARDVSGKQLVRKPHKLIHEFVSNALLFGDERVHSVPFRDEYRTVLPCHLKRKKGLLPLLRHDILALNVSQVTLMGRANRSPRATVSRAFPMRVIGLAGREVHCADLARRQLGHVRFVDLSLRFHFILRVKETCLI